MQQAAELASKPYEQMPWNPVAGLNNTQLAGLDYTRNLAYSGSPDVNAAQNVTLGTLAGNYLNGPAYQQTQVARNPYAGSNPYMQSMIGAAQGDVIDAYRRGTAAQTDAMAARSGTYGGTAHLEQQQMNQDQLLKALSGIENQFRFGDYTSQQGLAESAINRGVQAQQTDLGRATGSYEAERNRQMQAIPQAWQNLQGNLGP